MKRCNCFSADMGYHLDSCKFAKEEQATKKEEHKPKEEKAYKFKKMKMKKKKENYSNSSLPIEKL